MRAPATPPPARRAASAVAACAGAARDALGARSRLLAAGLKLFSERGFSRASTRAVADAAGTNIAAIRYYYGDKAGLYRTVFAEAGGDAPRVLVATLADPALTLPHALHQYYACHLVLLKQGEVARQTMRMVVREMLEPTAQWAEEVCQDVQGPHAALLALLARHLGVARVDDDLHRLAFNIAAPAMHVFLAQEIIHGLRPSLLASSRAIDRWCDSMTQQALAAVEAERTRRAALIRNRPKL